MHNDSLLKYIFCGWFAVVLFGGILGTIPSRAQAERTGDVFYGKLGVGLADYTGDFGSSSWGDGHSHPFDFQEVLKGFPYFVSAEVGYAMSPALSFGLALQGGNYPLADATYSNGTGQTRVTNELLGRYTVQAEEWRVAPYLEGGIAFTFGGKRLGVGPSLGLGVDIKLTPSTSLYVESRYNMSVPDRAVDNRSDAVGPNPELAPFPDRPFDLVNQLFGVGLKMNLGVLQSSSSTQDPSASPPAPSTAAVDTTDEDTRYDPNRYEDMVLAPDGTFIMGLTAEDPLSLQNAGRKRVTISAFYIDQHEVSNAEYRDYLSQLAPAQRQERLPDSTAWTEARSQESWGAYFRSELFSNYPVVGVTWEEAQAYCEAQNKRLPTEAEWEYAARAGHLGRVYPWQGLDTRNDGGDYLANYNPKEGYAFDGYAFTAPVDAFSANAWSLYNVAGNVAEWTRDAYTPSYDNISDFNPHYEDPNEPRRVVRGGAWNSNSFFIGVGVRDTQPMDEASASIGFRCVREVASLAEPQGTSDTPDAAESQEE